VPVLDLMLLIRLGQSIGLLATVALVLTTALTGFFIIARQRLGVVSRTLEALSDGRVPVQPVLDGLFLLVAGALLLTPGLVTDVMALALLIPPVRRAVALAAMRWLLRHTRAHVETFTFDGGRPGAPGRSPRPPGYDPSVIEGEFERLDERPAEPGPGRRGHP
jgi:UPF0716 protein FxsA